MAPAPYPPPPGYYPPQQYPPQPYAQQPPPSPPSDTPWGAIVLGLIGGLLAILGSILPWINFQTCTDAVFFRICLPFGVPGAWAGVGSYNALLGIAAPIALLLGIVGLILLFLNKPEMGLASAGLGGGVMVLGILHIAIATPLLAQMGVDISLLNVVSVTVTASIGVGVYLAIVGGIMLMLAGLLDWKMLKDKAAKKAKAEETAAPT